MSEYGREREAQRPSREAQREAVRLLREAVTQIRKASRLDGQGALLAEARALLERVERAGHEEVR